MAKRNTEGKGRGVIAGRQIDFLGYCFSKDNVRMRKSIKKRFARKVKETTNEKRRKQVLASYWGWCKWGNCQHLWKVVTNNDMSFANKGIQCKSTTKDGKRFFRNQEIHAIDILNNPIIVIDFEPNITTTHGPGRYAVLLQKVGEEKVYKLVTNSISIKDVLDQAREHDSRLKELHAQVDAEREKVEAAGETFSFEDADFGWSDADKALYEENQPILPCETVLKRRHIKENQYDYYFE